MDSELLDVVIGIAFVWFLYSTVLSGIGEAIALVLRFRAKGLWRGIGRLIDPVRSDAARTASNDLLGQVASFLLLRRPRDVRPRRSNTGDPPPRPAATSVEGKVQRVYDALQDQSADIARPGRRSKITQLARQAVADAVLSVATRAATTEALVAAARTRHGDAVADAVRAAIGEVTSADRATFVRLTATTDAVSLTEEELGSVFDAVPTALTVDDLQAFVSGNAELQSALERAVVGLVDGERIVAMRSTVEAWFDREMERASALYRRQARKVLIALAVPFVLVTHANAYALYEDLRRDDSLRAAVLSQALATGAVDELGDALGEGICGPPSTTTTTSSTASTTTSEPPITCGDEACRFSGPADEGGTGQPPAGQAAGEEEEAAQDGGSTATTLTPLAAAGRQLDCTADLLHRLERFEVGLTGVWPWDDGWGQSVFVDRWGVWGRSATVLAIAFGAQFWFDALRRLIGVRRFLTRDGSGAAG